MYQPVIDQAADKMEKTKDAYRRELVSLRAGRANPKLLDRIMVDYYGTQTPLNQMANIMSPEPRLLTISLWDPKAIPLVEKAILKSDLLDPRTHRPLAEIDPALCTGCEICAQVCPRDAILFREQVLAHG